MDGEKKCLRGRHDCMNINGHELNHLMDWCSSLKLLFRFTMQQVLDGSVSQWQSSYQRTTAAKELAASGLHLNKANPS